MTMLKSIGTGLLLLTLSTTVSAGEPVKAPRPAITFTPTVRVVGFHRSTQPGTVATVPSGSANAYDGGPYYVAVDVENSGGDEVSGVVVKLATGAKVLEANLTIPAKSTRPAIFTDADGMVSACKIKPYTVTLAGPNTGGVTRPARVSPNCTFTSTLEDGWQMKSPDNADYMQANHVYLIAPSLVTPPTCNGGPKIKVEIVSQYNGSSPSLVVQAKESGANGPVKAQTAAAFPLGPKEHKDLVLTPVAGANAEISSRLKLEIIDWTHSLNGHISDPGLVINTTRSCKPDFALLD